MKIIENLKDPLNGYCLNSGTSLFVFLASIPVNAWFQKASYVGLSDWIRKTIGSGLTSEASAGIAGAAAGTTFSFASRLPYGLLMTAFVMIFLFPAVRSGNKGTWGETLKRTCTVMMIPVLLLAFSSICMRISLALGVVFAVAALASCVSSIVLETRKGKWNGWFTVAWTSGFILITSVMLTNNHIVTMFS